MCFKIVELETNTVSQVSYTLTKNHLMSMIIIAVKYCLFFPQETYCMYYLI